MNRIIQTVADNVSGMNRLVEQYTSVTAEISDLKKMTSDLASTMALLNQGMQVLLNDRSKASTAQISASLPEGSITDDRGIADSSVEKLDINLVVSTVAHEDDTVKDTAFTVIGKEVGSNSDFSLKIDSVFFEDANHIEESMDLRQDIISVLYDRYSAQKDLKDVFSLQHDFNLIGLDHLVAESRLNNIGGCSEPNIYYASDGYLLYCVVGITEQSLIVLIHFFDKRISNAQEVADIGSVPL
ncbi:pyruvate decarboxylase [Ranunculus cassubicifolius]